MPSCVLRYCSNHSRKSSKSQGVTFHRFPPLDHENREAWIKFVQQNRSENTWLPSNYSNICSIHFRDEDKYYTKTGRLYLKKYAIPYDNATETIAKEAAEPEVSESLSDSISDSESIFDTSMKIVLKKKLHKVTKAKKALATKLKKMHRQNSYLKKKCAYYKTVIKTIKDNFNIDLNSVKDLMAKADETQNTFAGQIEIEILG